jgi:hypothetical protein
MITEQQHHRLCQWLYILTLKGICVTTYDGRDVIKVDSQKDEIQISGHNLITHKSYLPDTTFKDAMNKFYIPQQSLYIFRKIFKPSFLKNRRMKKKKNL